MAPGLLDLRKSLLHLLLVFSMGLLWSCGSAKKAAVPALPAANLVANGQAWSAAWQQQSGEYKTLCFQAYFVARLRLDEMVRKGFLQKPAIVTDIDETVLDNSPYTVHQSLQGLGYTEASWLEWTKRAEADTVPGALSFLQYAKSKGVEVFYITNRIEAERSATIANLKKWNFPDADTAHLLLKTSGSGKEDRRKKVLETHEIVLLMGDNLSDFNAMFDKKQLPERNELVRKNYEQFGNRFIVLPNPMYGDWESGYYRFNNGLNSAQKDSAVKSVMRNY